MSAREDFTQERAWAQIDHRLVSLKIQQASTAGKHKADRMPDAPRGNLHGRFAAWADLSIERANERAEKVYTIYLEVLEKQRIARTPAFLQVIFQQGVLPAIDAKIGTAQFNITNTARRLGEVGSLSPLLTSLEQRRVG